MVKRRHTWLPPVDVGQKYTIPEALLYERCTVPTLYKEINAGRLRVIKVGRRTYVPGSELVRRAQLPQPPAPEAHAA